MWKYRWFGAAAMIALLGWQPGWSQAGNEGLPAAGLDLSAPSGGVDMGSLDFEASSMYTSPSSGLSLASAANLGESGGIAKSYMNARLGPLWFLGDAEDLDTGLNFEIAYGYRLLEILSLEAQTGVFWGEENPVDLWGLPITVNGKIHVPITLFDLYAGAGIGGYYIDVDTGFVEDEDFVFGGQIFVGAGVEVGPVGIGAELKYFATTDAELLGGDVSLEGVTLMATATLKF